MSGRFVIDIPFGARVLWRGFSHACEVESDRLRACCCVPREAVHAAPILAENLANRVLVVSALQHRFSEDEYVPWTAVAAAAVIVVGAVGLAIWVETGRPIAVDGMEALLGVEEERPGPGGLLLARGAVTYRASIIDA